ncbi:MAG: hypothetical protein FJX56_04485 [Alphaproteobacteria bacterium]|nr:hypothetical protein [Alphaproteobacteria bacterium]
MDNAEASKKDVRAILGELGDLQITAVLEFKPTTEELEEPAAWLAGEEDIVRLAGHTLSARAAEICEIAGAAEVEEPERGGS